jgi:hypothetical protein
MTLSKPRLKPASTPKPKVEIIELSEDSGAIFQAIGVLPCEVQVEPKSFQVKVEGKTYRLWYASEKRQVAHALRRRVKETGVNQRLIVYPHVLHLPKKPYEISFQLVGFVNESAPKRHPALNELQDMEFKLCGFWRFIPVCRIPVVSVHKNFNEERLKIIKEANVQDRVKILKPTHVPLDWDAPVTPLRFNPKQPKEQMQPPTFVQVLAKFSPERDLFEFIALSSPPANNSPRFMKVRKSDKLEASAAKRKEKAIAKNNN